MRQTSIEWLIEQVSAKEPNGQYVIDTLTDEEVEAIFDQAMQMHKEEIVEAFIGHDSDTEENIDVAEQYYQETYGGNQ